MRKLNDKLFIVIEIVFGVDHPLHCGVWSWDFYDGLLDDWSRWPGILSCSGEVVEVGHSVIAETNWELKTGEREKILQNLTT